MTREILARALEEGKAPTVAVFGDFCLDRYVYIDASRDEPSLETGLTAWQITHERCQPGAAGTITNNLRALGADVLCIGILGQDGAGYELKKALNRVGASTEFMVETGERCTCCYLKPMRCEGGKETEQNRHDYKNFTPTPRSVEDALLGQLRRALPQCDAVLVCDQYLEPDCAAVTAYVRTELAQMAEEFPNVVFYVDSRGFIDQFDKMMIKCNHNEIAHIFGVSPDTVDVEAAGHYASKLSERTGRPVVVTLGERGNVVWDGTEATHVPAFPVTGEIDVVGAGDACNAGLVFALCKGLPLKDAALVGNAASHLVIQQIGTTGTATLAAVEAVLKTK